MSYKNLFKFFILLSYSCQSFGIKGDDLISIHEVKENLCLIEAKYEGLNGKKGICTGVIFNEYKIVTAKHCLLKDPRQASPEIIDNPLNDKDMVDIQNISVKCGNRKNIEIDRLVTHDSTDLGVIKTISNLTPMIRPFRLTDLENELQNEMIRGCSLHGFGFNNDNKIGLYSGVNVQKLQVYTVDYAMVEIRIDADFKAMSRTFANSMFAKIFMDKFHFPNLIYASERQGIAKQTLAYSLEEFEKKLSENQMSFSSVFNKEYGPLYKDLFFDHFKDLYIKAFSAQMNSLRSTYVLKDKPLYRLISNVSNINLEQAGMDYGDSGGALICNRNGQNVLAGIISGINTDSNNGYISKPWEPMNYRPQTRLTKNGEVIPLVGVLRDWINSL